MPNGFWWRKGKGLLSEAPEDQDSEAAKIWRTLREKKKNAEHAKSLRSADESIGRVWKILSPEEARRYIAKMNAKRRHANRRAKVPK